MPEYLSPGVYIEEIPARLKAIEGVSTSTGGLVGRTRRGAVSGFALPFAPTNGFALTADAAPTLVTSFADFMRFFGEPLALPDPLDNSFLGHAVRAFFDNGGKRCFIARIVGAGASRTAFRIHQGNILRLSAPVRAADQNVRLNSVRGLSVGNPIRILRRSDNSNALSLPPQAAVVTSTNVEPFALVNADQLGVRVDGGAVVNMTPALQAQPAQTDLTFPTAAAGLVDVTAAAGVALPISLEIRVGPATNPTQIIQFVDTDFPTPASAQLLEFVAVLAREAVGVQVDLNVATDTITLRTDNGGTASRVEIVSLSAGAPFAPGGVTPLVVQGTGNVADIGAVTIDEIAALFPGAGGFVVRDDGAGHLQFVSTGTGATVSLELVNTAGNPVASLGFAPGVVSGTTPAAPADPVVTEVDSRLVQVRLSAAPGVDLDPTTVYVIRTADGVPQRNGPVFHARSPGAWSERLRTLITPSDRSAVAITEAANGADSSVRVQTPTSFYRGGILEINHGASGLRTQHEVTDIAAGNRLILNPGLGGTGVDTTGTAQVLEIDVTVTDESGPSLVEEVFRGLTWNPINIASARARHYATVINARSRLVYVQPPGVGGLNQAEAATLATQPITVNGFSFGPTGAEIGQDGADPADDDFVGVDNGPGARTGVHSLRDIEDIRIVAVPGKTGAIVHNALITQCETLRYRFAVIDGGREEPIGGSVNSILGHRNAYDSSFGAYYAPWVETTERDQRILLPPSGFVAGIYARTDNSRGVHKAPANEVVRGITGLATYLTTGEQDLLNPRSVNAIRRFEGRGIRVWGARTLSSDPEYRYVNVRRFLIFMEASIDRGTQWVVFEPNSPETWGRVVDSVSAFLHTQWRSGALVGRRPEDAFYVRCDETTMSVDDIQNGRLICNIGVAIVRPAEFVIFRIEQLAGLGARV